MAKTVIATTPDANPPMPLTIPDTEMARGKTIISYDELIAGKVIVENTLGQRYYIVPTFTGGFILRVRHDNPS
jgi:hypothetical protein